MTFQLFLSFVFSKCLIVINWFRVKYRLFQWRKTGIVCLEELRITQLPSLPDKTDYLHCWENKLKSLPKLPPHLIALTCWGNEIQSLPELPITLDDLNCCMNRIRQLPFLPFNLRTLDCCGNDLTVLPDLPASLTYLECSLNNLTSLPTLPIGLKFLECYQNKLTSLPILPDSLLHLDCADNNLVSLPYIPNGILFEDVGFFQNKYLHVPKDIANRIHKKQTPNYPFITQQLKNIFNAVERRLVLTYCDMLHQKIDEFRYRPGNAGYLELKKLNIKKFFDL